MHTEATVEVKIERSEDTPNCVKCYMEIDRNRDWCWSFIGTLALDGIFNFVGITCEEKDQKIRYFISDVFDRPEEIAAATRNLQRWAQVLAEPLRPPLTPDQLSFEAAAKRDVNKFAARRSAAQQDRLERVAIHLSYFGYRARDLGPSEFVASRKNEWKCRSIEELERLVDVLRSRSEYMEKD